MEKFLRLLCWKAYNEIIVEINKNFSNFSFVLQNNILWCTYFVSGDFINININLLEKTCAKIYPLGAGMWHVSNLEKFYDINDIIDYIKYQIKPEVQVN